MSRMKLCPFPACNNAIPLHLFACCHHWRGLSDNARNAVQEAAHKYRTDEISAEEFQRLGRAVVDDATEVAAAATSGRRYAAPTRPLVGVCRRCAKRVVYAAGTDGTACLEELTASERAALADELGVVVCVIGGRVANAVGEHAAVTRFKTHVCGRIGP